MAGIGDTARLIASLELNDSKFQRGIARSMGGLGKLEGGLKKLGASTKRGLSNAATNISRLALVGVAGLGVAIGKGIQSLVDLENATTSVDGAIKQMGKTGQVTSAQIATWANQIEGATQAAFDDKEIVAGTAGLIRYGNIATSNLRPAMVVMTNLAAKTGSVESASTALAKAMADPTKATKLLRMTGVTLTKQQEKQLKIWVKNGKLAKAQALILKLVAEKTKNAARDAFGPAADAQHVLNDAIEDGTKLLAVGFLPVLTKIAGKLQAALDDPETMGAIKTLGQGLADALEQGIGIVERLPWAQIKSSFATGVEFGKKLLDTFTGMPAWVQTAVLTGWGLNKLTGGAVVEIGTDLAGGIIKGLAGSLFSRGGSPAMPLYVSAVGGTLDGPVPVGGPDGGKGGKLSPIGKAFNLLSKLAIVGLVAEFATEITGLTDKIANEIGEAIGLKDITGAIADAIGSALHLDIPPASEWQWPIGPKNTPTILPEIFGGNGLLGGTPAGTPTPAGVDPLKPVLTDAEAQRNADLIAAKIEAAREEQVAAINDTGSSTGKSIRGTTDAVSSAQAAITSAVYASRPSFTAITTVTMSPASVEKTTTIIKRYGNQNGSAGGGPNVNPNTGFTIG